MQDIISKNILIKLAYVLLAENLAINKSFGCFLNLFLLKIYQDLIHFGKITRDSEKKFRILKIYLY